MVFERRLLLAFIKWHFRVAWLRFYLLTQFCVALLVSVRSAPSLSLQAWLSQVLLRTSAISSRALLLLGVELFLVKWYLPGQLLVNDHVLTPFMATS